MKLTNRKITQALEQFLINKDPKNDRIILDFVKTLTGIQFKVERA